jgi:chromosome segregation protein
VHLSSITIKGFKSFPERTRLVLAGVSVIVGPNGCGKSNITDAVLWALGEQSPLAVRGQTMQDMIFAGGDGEARAATPRSRWSWHDHPRRPAADAGEMGMPEPRRGKDSCGSSGGLSEISIRRRLERNGDGEYRHERGRARAGLVT